MLPLFLLILSLFAHFPAEALQCYDCMSKAVPNCTKGNEASAFDKRACQPDEIYCSMLVMNDTAGQLLVTRQCASRRDEGEQLTKYVRGAHDKNLKMLEFVTCQQDLCNTQSPRDMSSGGSKYVYEGSTAGKNSSAAVAVPSALVLGVAALYNALHATL